LDRVCHLLRETRLGLNCGCQVCQCGRVLTGP
jgi:hypothetical protein